MDAGARVAVTEERDPSEAEFRAVLERLLECRRDVLAREDRLRPLLQEVPEENRASARNLVHYLALRQHDLGPLQEVLARLGLSSLGRSESHVLANIEAVIAVLHRLLGMQPPSWPAQVDAEEAGTLLSGRTETLFGARPEGRPSSIMVTMPTAAGEDYALVRSLLASGMDCMRINCAHDDRSVWEGMVSNLRQAERELGRSCKVLMDIPGPRVRTGDVAAVPEALKLRPARDALGWVTAPAEVRLVPVEEGPQLESSPEPRLSVDAGFLDRLRVGDKVEFRDTRGSARSMIITTVTPGACRARLDRTAYIAVGTRLSTRRAGAGGRRRRFETEVVAVPTKQPAIMLSRGDLLVLTRSQTPGGPARRDAANRLVEMAHVPCYPPDALDWVRAGQQIWFDDGRIGGVIQSVDAEKAVVEITSARLRGEKLAADRGINLPDTEFHFPALTPEDLEDLTFIAANADLVGYSFLRRAEDVEALQRELRKIGAARLSVVLKIETRAAYEDLPRILLVALRSRAAGVMIARGDLAVECGFTRLAEVQEEILWLSEAAHMPVIWATQVLDRLARRGLATRAEVTDAAMAERAECVMLNKGDFMIEAVQALDSILGRMQHHQHKKRALMTRLPLAERFFRRWERSLRSAAPADGQRSGKGGG